MGQNRRAAASLWGEEGEVVLAKGVIGVNLLWQNATGMEMIPNRDFWGSLPGLVKVHQQLVAVVWAAGLHGPDSFCVHVFLLVFLGGWWLVVCVCVRARSGWLLLLLFQDYWPQGSHLREDLSVR